jgi:hypothetical protein
MRKPSRFTQLYVNSKKDSKWRRSLLFTAPIRYSLLPALESDFTVSYWKNVSPAQEPESASGIHDSATFTLKEFRNFLNLI